jgi:hypothetical protein
MRRAAHDPDGETRGLVVAPDLVVDDDAWEWEEEEGRRLGGVSNLSVTICGGGGGKGVMVC